MCFSSSLDGLLDTKREGLSMIKSGFPLMPRDIRLRNAFETDVWYNAPMEGKNICSQTFYASLHLQASPVAARVAQGGRR
jgi:hypothetical protein